MFNLVEEVADYFRDLVDEPDTTFLTPAMATRFLKIGYSEWVNHILKVVPNYLEQTIPITLSNAASLDLTTGAWAVLGTSSTPPANPRLMQLNEFMELNPDGTVCRALDIVPSIQANLQASRQGKDTVFLTSSSLVFSRALTGSYQFSYSPEPSTLVDWTKVSAGDNEFIDGNMSMFTDLIAMFAARQYHAVDDSMNKVLEAQLQKREVAFSEYLGRRSYRGSRYVTAVEDY